MIRATGNLDMICLRGRTEQRNFALPSWVPDWSALTDVDRPNLFKSVLNNNHNGKFKDGIANLFRQVDDSYGTRVERDILCVSGRFFGCVDGLSTGMLDDNTPVGKIEQPSDERTGYEGRQGHPSALFDTLKMQFETPDEEQSSDRADLVHYLLRPKGIEVMESHGHNLLCNWILASHDFKICGVRLHVWLGKFLGEHWKWKKRIIHHYEDKAEFTTKMQKYMTDVETALSGGMRIMTTTCGLLGMAHPQARPGDHICLLEGMSSPVILRPCSDEELGADAVAKREDLEEQWKMLRYAKGLQIETAFSQNYKVVGEAFVRMEGMLKNVQEFPHPFMTFVIH